MKIFVRVLRSYSVEEKIISIIVLGIVVFTAAQAFVDLFKNPNVFSTDGKSYTEGMVSDRPVIINPLYVDFNEPARDISSLVFAGLSKYDPSNHAFVDDMGVLKISEDKMTYHFTLKPGLLWHDGQPLTADDVYFTFHDIIQSPAFQNPVLKLDFDGVEIKEIDAQNIEFKLKKPNAFFITNMNVGILPKHVLADTPVDELPTSQFNVKPVGSGPYKVDPALEIFDDGREHVTLKAFDGYFGEHPRINQIHFNIYPDFETLQKEIGTVNVVAKVPTASMADLQKLGRFSFINYELPQYTAVFFNVENSVLKNDKVRVGLMKAVDKQQLLQQFSDKIEVDTPLLDLNQQDWIYKPNLDEAKGALYDAGYKLVKTQQQVPGGTQQAAGTQQSSTQQPVSATQQSSTTQQPVSTQQTTLTQQSSDSSHQSSQQVAQTAQPQSSRVDKNGKPLKFVLLARAYDPGSALEEETKKTTDFLKNQWAQLGLTIDVQMVDGDTYLQRLQARDYDMALAGQSLGYNLDTYSYWHSSQATPKGLNLSNYRSFGADQLIENIRDTFDPAQKDKYLKQLAKVIADDVPAVFLYRPKYTLASDGKVQGIVLQNLAFASDRFAAIGQ
ncbi:MAG: ABC transporter substrate-binding protein, partial [Firmicutes bacterium]|nr:ABC transporter substrate-binding protein [Bacillota bacterium]